MTGGIHPSAGVLETEDVPNWLRRSLDTTELVTRQLDEALGAFWSLPYSTIAMIPNATRRISTELDVKRAQDTCAVFHASRVFNNLTGGYILLRKGFVVEATTVIRTALETVAQAALFLRDEREAEKWLNGKKYQPRDVRQRLGSRPDFKPLYDELSQVAHANPEARWAHSLVVSDDTYAISFGGTYQPKAVGQLLAVLVEVNLVYLSQFHGCYGKRLSLDFWPVLIDIYRGMLEEFRGQVAARPHDWEALIPGVTLMDTPMDYPGVDPAELEKVRALVRERTPDEDEPLSDRQVLG